MQWEDGGLWMEGLIAVANSADHNGWAYIIRVTEIGRLIIHNTRHTHKTPVQWAVSPRVDFKQGLDA